MVKKIIAFNIKNVLAFLLMAGATSVYGQKDRSLSFELAGSGGFGSINFEKNIYLKSENEPIVDELMSPKKIGFRLDMRYGFSVTPVDKNNGVVLIFPVMLHAVKSKGNHGLDLGLGQTISITTRGRFFIMMPASIGYRFQPLDKKYYVRFAYTPIISYLIDFQYQHWGGITFGYRLKNKS
jgi:hypothetical protein